LLLTLFCVLAVGIVVPLAARSHEFWDPVWLGVLILVSVAVPLTLLVYGMATAGVRETAVGLEWRTGPMRGDRVYRGEVEWADIRSFGYLRVKPLVERVVVSCRDGTRKVIWSGPRQMRWGWRGEQAWTGDFAQTLTDRARRFGAPIE